MNHPYQSQQGMPIRGDSLSPHTQPQRIQSHSSQRQMTRSEYMMVKNIPVAVPAKRYSADREAQHHRLRASTNPILELREVRQEQLVL